MAVQRPVLGVEVIHPVGGAAGEVDAKRRACRVVGGFWHGELEFHTVAGLDAQRKQLVKLVVGQLPEVPGSG